MSADYIHTITINAEKETVESIRNFVRSDYHIFDFHNIGYHILHHCSDHFIETGEEKNSPF